MAIKSLALGFLALVASAGNSDALPVLPSRIPGVAYMTNHPWGEPLNATQTATLIKAATSGKLANYGGPVINNVEVTLLTWGTGVNYVSSAAPNNLPTFYAGVTNSAYYDMLAQYGTSSQGSIGRGTYKGTIALSGVPSGSSITDAQIQTYLKSLVTKGTIKPNKNSYYPIHFAPGITIALSSSDSSCSTFCAYHGTIDISSLNVGTQYLFYGVMPDQGGACAGGCGSASSTFKNLCSVSSHELFEAVTDAAVGLAQTYGPPLAWYNNPNGEIGDLCNAQQATITDANGQAWTVQKQWSNSKAACASS
ncbi:hypothetical protein M427DRAFT_50864 [Gonapodya prolifera JEL478]|uniref:Phosphate-induced protein 1 n=1 Tax=Gonapodya prolifera (strain JEL478) TaxID=1344416 RepID=A0A139B0S3_GONPJ|nr:hypothetical protein M427DRAFT_50864 [Gonapodya prolifera JEL478]|eukprot:KXS22567.1 hypothetical protein M427DRAFT_50864 [Gonapodya prolifera JEL478]